jgi:putative methyltransferase
MASLKTENIGLEMRIYWLNPPLSTKIIYPDLGWMSMNTYCKEYEWIQPIINWEEHKSLDDVVEHVLTHNPDVLCVSSYIWNHVLISDVCKEIKSIRPDIIIIRGGPQLEKQLDFSWYDYVCDAVGYGEQFLEAALKQIKNNGVITKPEEVPWLIDKDRKFLHPKVKYKYPNESVFEHNIAYVAECFAVAKSRNVRFGAQYETTRGCPYSCTYCEWGAGGTSAKVSEKQLDIILKDIELLAMLGVRDFEIIDANFGIMQRDVDIVNFLGEMKKKYGAPDLFMLYGLAKVRVDKKERILDAIFENGLMHTYFMSLQSSSPVALENVKRKDISIEDNIRLAKKYRDKYGITVKVELILGLPGSTIDDFYYEMDLIQQTGGWDWPRAPFSILPQTEAADKLYQALHKIKTARVGISENEEQDITYVSYNTVLTGYKSYQDIVISSSSYTVEEWKEMFFMNKAQKVIGPMIPENLKASEVMRWLFTQICKREWYTMFEDDMNRIVSSNKQEDDFMIVNGKAVEDHMKEHVDEIRTLVDEYTRTR